MLNSLLPEIHEDSKLIIGLGDSFTHGIGSWSKEDYIKHNGRIDPITINQDMEITAYENSWVNQLHRQYMPDHIPANFGRMGRGNRAAVKELYLNPKIEFNNAEDGVLIFLLSGIERFDFIAREFTNECHFYTMWPNPGDPGTTNKQLWNVYHSDIWSEKFVVAETILNIKEAELFCRAQGYKLVLASAFDQRINRDYFLNVLGKESIKLVDSVKWNNFLYPRGCLSFLELLLDLEGRRELISGGYIDYYTKLEYPSRYITNCYHPTQEGYSVIAKELFEFIDQKGSDLYV